MKWTHKIANAIKSCAAFLNAVGEHLQKVEHHLLRIFICLIGILSVCDICIKIILAKLLE